MILPKQLKMGNVTGGVKRWVKHATNEEKPRQGLLPEEPNEEAKNGDKPVENEESEVKNSAERVMGAVTSIEFEQKMAGIPKKSFAESQIPSTTSSEPSNFKLQLFQPPGSSKILKKREQVPAPRNPNMQKFARKVLAKELKSAPPNGKSRPKVSAERVISSAESEKETPLYRKKSFTKARAKETIKVSLEDCQLQSTSLHYHDRGARPKSRPDLQYSIVFMCEQSCARLKFALTSKDLENMASQLPKVQDIVYKTTRTVDEMLKLFESCSDPDKSHRRQCSVVKFAEPVRLLRAIQAHLNRFCELLQRPDVYEIALEVIPVLKLDQSFEALAGNPIITQILQQTRHLRPLARQPHPEQRQILDAIKAARTPAVSKPPRKRFARVTQVESLDFKVKSPYNEETISQLKDALNSLWEGHQTGMDNDTCAQEQLPRRDGTSCLSKQDAFRMAVKERVLANGEPWEPEYYAAEAVKMRNSIVLPSLAHGVKPVGEVGKRLFEPLGGHDSGSLNCHCDKCEEKAFRSTLEKWGVSVASAGVVEE